jgi:hypothetical protein
MCTRARAGGAGRDPAKGFECANLLEPGRTRDADRFIGPIRCLNTVKLSTRPSRCVTTNEAQCASIQARA